MTRFRSPESKLVKVRELNGCIKCGFLNHTESSCRYKFSAKCRGCNKYHAQFLCLGAPKL